MKFGKIAHPCKGKPGDPCKHPHLISHKNSELINSQTGNALASSTHGFQSCLGGISIPTVQKADKIRAKCLERSEHSTPQFSHSVIEDTVTWPWLTSRRRGGVTFHVPKCGGEQDSLVTTDGVYHSGSTVYFFLITFPRLLGSKERERSLKQS